jgi:hypothetical protein
MTAIQDDKPTSGKRHRRKIRFHERVQFKTIPHVSEFSDDEIKHGWYDKDDFNRMSENVSDIAKLIADGETTLDGEELCTRGLEHIVEEELADYRAEKMINSIDAVLDEQEEQWDEGKEEPRLIAELYAEYAKPLLQEAHMIGLKDAEQGYKSWDELLNEKQYQKLAIKQNTSPSRTGKGGGKTKIVGKAKKTKKASSDTFNGTGKTEKTGIVKTKVKKNKVQEQPAQSNPTKQYVPASEKKKKVKRGSFHQSEEKGKDKSSTQLSLDDSFSSSSFQSSTSFQLSPPTPTPSSRQLKNQGSYSSINSCTLRDLSSSISEEFDAIVETEKYIPTKEKVFSSVPTKNNTSLLESKQKLSLQPNGKDNKPISPKKQRKTQPRRTAMERKNGSELSPFVFRRDGTLTFRKPDVERLKREQKEKRKNCIRGSMTKFLYGDEEEVDILAGILSGGK